MKYCQTCAWWVSSGLTGSLAVGWCQNFGLRSAGFDHVGSSQLQIDAAPNPDGRPALVMTAPNFGCTEHEDATSDPEAGE